MFSQTIALILISLIMFFLFARKTGFRYSMGILPIALIPIVSLLGFPISTLISKIAVNTPIYMLRIMVSIVGLAVACAFIGIASVSIPVKKVRIFYSAMLAVYCVVLTIIYIKNIIAFAMIK